MKKNEVPQDDENLLEGKFGKVNYALDGKRHLKPDHFKSLDQDMLAKYAKVFNITIDELKNFK
ncbi:MAG: hypothetical protein IPG55_02445 [Saprospiraceae bacterium]|nr:hypothetical protein [Candidatus Defluviibacterium haderslevense]